MTLESLKQTYLKINNINLVNTINEIQEINERTFISINKIITFLISNCTSKIKRKNLSILESHYPYTGELSPEEIAIINNKNYQVSNEEKFKQLEEDNKEISKPIFKTQKYKNSSYKKQKSINNINESNTNNESEQKNEKESNINEI